MADSRQDAGSGDDERFPVKQLFILAICRLAEPVAFTSIMSYTFIMVQDFPGIDDTSASFYAGLLVSAFAVGEVCTAMTWGTISDHYGRKPIILIGLAGTALSSLIFGLATNFWMALAARLVGGLLNGNVAVMQTMVAEMCKKPEWEPKAYAMMPFIWSFGVIIGAAMGGFLAQPAHYYPSIFASDGLFGKYPYLLPNLVAVVFIILAIIQGYLFLEETNPRLQKPAQKKNVPSNALVDENTSLIPRRQRQSTTDALSTGHRRPSFVAGSMPTMNEPSFDIRRNSVTTIHSIKPVVQTSEVLVEEGSVTETSVPIKAFNRSVILWIIALVIMSYGQMSFGALFPIYLLDRPDNPNPLDLNGGLGYTVHDVGVFMSANGLLAFCIQALIFPPFVERVGVRNSIIWLSITCPLAFIIVPFLSLFHGRGLTAGIYIVMIIEDFFMIVLYPCFLIALKNATPSTLVLGKVNGLAMSACSGARTLSPPLVGLIYGAAGSAAAWWSIAAVSAVGALELFWLMRLKDGGDVTVENVLNRTSTRETVQAPRQEEQTTSDTGFGI